MPPAPAVSASVRLMMAVLVAAVRTAKFEEREYMGARSPRMAAAVANSFQLTNRLCAYAERHWPEWFPDEQGRDAAGQGSAGANAAYSPSPKSEPGGGVKPFEP